MPVLEFQNVSYSYPQSEKKALKNVSFSVDSGDYVALLGANGSGKSTASRIMAGFIQPEEGELKIDDDVLPGIVFQQPKEQIVAGERQATGLSKAPWVCTFVRALLEAGEKVLLFAHHHSVFDYYRKECINF